MFKMVNTNLVYDNDMSQFLFDNNFIEITNDSYLFIDFGNLSDDFDKSNFFNIYSEINKIKKLIINEDIVDSGNLKNNDHSLSIFDDLLCGNYGHNLDEIEELLNDFKIHYTYNYESVKIVGNSQGDVAQILINKKEFLKIMGVGFVESDYTEYFTNLFYGTHISGEIIIQFDYKVRNCLMLQIPLKSYSRTYDYQEVSQDNHNLNLNIDYILKNLPKKVSESLKVKLISELESLDYKSVCYD